MEVEPFGRVGEYIADSGNFFFRNRGIQPTRQFLRRGNTRLLGRFAALLCSADIVKHGFELFAEVSLNNLDLVLREVTTPDQAAGVNVTHSRLVIDDLVHLGLRH